MPSRDASNRLNPRGAGHKYTCTYNMYECDCVCLSHMLCVLHRRETPGKFILHILHIFLLDTEGIGQTAGVSHQDFLPQELPAPLGYYILQLHLAERRCHTTRQVVHSGVFGILNKFRWQDSQRNSVCRLISHRAWVPRP